MKTHRFLHWTLTSLLLALLTACSTDKEALLPHGDQTMKDIWNHAGSVGSQQQLLDARSALRRPLQDSIVRFNDQASYSRTAQTEIHNLFPRLPNPDLVLYVYPHLSGSEQAPVPGYSTVFSLYRTVQYAQPGDRLDDL